MNQRTPTSATPSASGPHAGATGGPSAFALFYLGYAYVYVSLLTADGM